MSRKNIFAILFVLLAAGGGYFWYRYSPSAPEGEASKETSSPLAELQRLKTLQLDTLILQDSFFKSLSLPSEVSSQINASTTAGRSNPFLPF